ncbi:MAG TPA: 2-oxoacid:ferredoxin oxidoreductase subunit beta [Firmicutes bacterium]|nr:2-oxoacid:ferredoxin oxidoreductase subunit beta [Bacillota bacterium]
MPLLEVSRPYLIDRNLPHFWCPGCGNGIILSAVARAFGRLGWDRRQTVVVTGIGCFGRADDYLNVNAVHGTHGRALAIAAGIKATSPGLKVVALMGDGDCATIGGNHFLHAARRNLSITAVVANNLNYGMTGGQYSATTPVESRTSTSPLGHAEEGFDLCQVAAAAGAMYVARATVYHVHLLDRYLLDALSHPGFSLVEVMSSCPVYYGRYNRLGGPVEMMQYWQKVAVPWEKFRQLPEDERRGKVAVGVMREVAGVPFEERYRRVQEAARKGVAIEVKER